MDRLTIVYVNGYEEIYNILQHNVLDPSLYMLHFKQLIENNMLKLIIDHNLIQMIPLTQIQKIIIHPSDTLPLANENGLNGFLPVTIEKSPFTSYHDLQ